MNAEQIKTLIDKWYADMQQANNDHLKEDVCRRHEALLGDSGSRWLLWYWMVAKMGTREGCYFSFGGKKHLRAMPDISCLVTAYQISHQRHSRYAA